jgi:hypothetical protein
MLMHTDIGDKYDWRVESDICNGKFTIRIDPSILVSPDRHLSGQIIDRLISILQLRMQSAYYEMQATLGRGFAGAIPIPDQRDAA